MSAGVKLRWVYRFANRARVVEFGPYASEDEAREAFQRIYGYWPADVLEVERWTPQSESA